MLGAAPDSAFRGFYEDFLVSLIEEGQAIAAEIVRLADFIPNDFVNPSTSRYRPILLNFSYFQRTEAYENAITKIEGLQEDFYSAFENELQSFELLFQSTASYIHNFIEYAEQIGNDSSLTPATARELELLSLYTLGLVFIYLDRYITGDVRERLFVAIFRNSDNRRNVEFLVDFLRAPVSATDILFSRVSLNRKFVSNCMTLFDNGWQTVAQTNSIKGELGPIAFVCLFFSLDTLYKDSNRMRVIVDLVFREQWVFNLGMGLIVNLFDEWLPFKSAATAIQAQIDTAKATLFAQEHMSTLTKIDLPQGKVQPSQFAALTTSHAQFNSSLKWLLLHTFGPATGKKALSYQTSVKLAVPFEAKSLLYVLKVARFEADFIKGYNECLRNRDEKAQQLTSEVCATIDEIAELFAQGVSSLKVEKKLKLKQWFLLMKETLEKLDTTQNTCTDIVYQIRSRISQVSEMLDLGGSLAMAQYLEALQKQLDSLAAIFSVNAETAKNIEIAADGNYLWIIIDSWTARLQRLLLESSNTHPIRALFHKLSLSVTVLIGRFSSDERKMMIGRAYSYRLERRLCNVLQSVPEHLFEIMRTIVIPALQRKWEPTLEKATIRELADFDDNYQLAEATFTISNMSIGISKMALKKIGTIDVNPKALLENGIRRQLKCELPKLFTFIDRFTNIQEVVQVVSRRVHSFHAAFIYMSDHMNVNGHRLWMNEISNFVDDVVAAEVADTKASSGNGKKAKVTNAIVLIAEQLLKSTSPSTSRCYPNDRLWKDAKTKQIALNSHVAAQIETLLPTFAISGLDNLFTRQSEQAFYDTTKLIGSILQPFTTLSMEGDWQETKEYMLLVKAAYSNLNELTKRISSLGQLCLLRDLVLSSRRSEATLRASPLFQCLQNLNGSIFLDMSSLGTDTSSLCALFKACAISDPSKSLFKPVSLPPNAVPFLFTLVGHIWCKPSGSRMCLYSYYTGFSILLRQLSLTSEIVTLLHDSIDKAILQAKSAKSFEPNRPLKMLLLNSEA